MRPRALPADFASRPLDEIIKHWVRRDPGQWKADASLYVKLAEHFLDLSEYILAYGVAAEGLELFKGDKRWVALRVRLQQFQGLALARSGAAEKARKIFDSLRRRGHVDEETLGGLARTHKDLGLAATGNVRAKHLLRSHELYTAAYDGKAGNYWTGINAATTALLLGKIDRAKTLAREVRAHCLAMSPDRLPPPRDAYWLRATIAEASLILGEWDKAELWYRRAVAAAPRDWGRIASTRRAARLIVGTLADETLRERVDRCLHIPNIVVFAGHMMDRLGRPVPRFPASLKGPVRKAIRAKLEELDAGIGFASGACGSDILFLEAMRARHGEFNIVLPYEQKGFIKDSVDIVQDSTWGRRLSRLIAHCKPVIASHQRAQLESVTYDYANILLHGLAKMRADQLETQLIPLAVWDGQPGDGRGGTADVVQRWRTFGCKPEILDLAALLRTHHPGSSAAPAPPPGRNPRRGRSLPREVKAMLFADVEDFSLIPEEDFPRFTKHFLGRVARLTRESPSKPVIRNTWGDALFLVFDSVEQAGCFALELRDLMSQTNWLAHGFEKKLKIRIAIHTGPVFAFRDPVAGRFGCIGSHVNRAARLEPVTPAGRVYASQEFAALASLHELPFVCDYAGSIPFAKKFGTFPAYHVRRK